MLVLGWCAPAVQAAQAAQAPPELEVLDGGEARTVKLHVETGSPPRLVGQTVLFVRNASSTDARFRATFVSADGSRVRRLSGASKRIFLKRAWSSSAAPADARMKSKEVRALRLGFSLPPGEPAAVADGSLVLRLGGKTKMVAITGAGPEFKDVTVSPKKLALDTDESTATLTLSGSGLVEFLRRRGSGDDPTAELRSDSGETARVTATLPTAAAVAKRNPYRAQATIELPDDSPPAGEYTGTLVLSDLGSEGLSVELELNSHRSIFWLIGLVLVGVLLGTVVTRLVAMAMRRALLLATLSESMAAYRHVRTCNGKTLSWRLEDMLDEPPSAASLKGNRLQGVPALETSIKSARSSKDLDEDAARVLETVARIQRWLRVEPVARRLALVAEVGDHAPLKWKKGKKITRREWRQSRTWRDTQILLELARVEPQTPAAADDLVDRLLSQIKWHHRFLIAWDESAKTQELSEQLNKIDEGLGDDGAVVTRKPELQDALDVRLEAFFEEKLKSRGVRPTDAPKPDDLESVELGITPVKWEASANLFTGWATLDSQSYGQLARRAATSARALTRPDWRMELKAIDWPRDGVWTLAILTLSSAAYGIEAYSDTWGSGEDLAAAFLAGFAGKAVVDWAALPIFQSIRLRASEPQPAAASAPSAPAASAPETAAASTAEAKA